MRLRNKAFDRGSFIRKVGKYPMQISQTQYFCGSRAQIHGPQFRAIVPGGVQAANELADSRTVEIRNVTKVQQDFRAPFSK